MSKAAILTLRLEGPMQAWGSDAKWDYRATELYPTKSGVVGLLACALGLERGDAEIAEIADAIQMAVRADRPGERMLDYQTITGAPLLNAEGKKRAGGQTFISRREYLADASFLVALEGPGDLIDRLSTALERPHWPYYLGRKNCIPACPVLEKGKRSYDSLSDALQHHPLAERAAGGTSYGCESELPIPNSGLLTRGDQNAAGTQQFEKRHIYRGKVHYDSEQTRS